MDDNLTSVSVVIVAAGSGSRMGLDKNKQFIDLGGMPMIARTLLVFEKIPRVESIILVTRDRDIDEASEIVKRYGVKKVTDIIPGGETRSQSVMCGLKRLDADKDSIVLIHDGARPFISPNHILKLISEIESGSCEAAAVGVRVKDTIKQIDDYGFISTTPDRNSLISIQTPQCFRFDLIMKAHTRARNKDLDFTDDCAVVEALSGERIKVVEGDYNNIKITTPEDLVLAEKILESR